MKIYVQGIEQVVLESDSEPGARWRGQTPEGQPISFHYTGPGDMLVITAPNRTVYTKGDRTCKSWAEFKHQAARRGFRIVESELDLPFPGEQSCKS
jgi:hypothetical protein